MRIGNRFSFNLMLLVTLRRWSNKAVIKYEGDDAGVAPVDMDFS
jgi:hypothetical protein